MRLNWKLTKHEDKRGYLSHYNQFTSHGPINRWFDNAILILEDYITKLQELAWITTECNN